MLAPAQVVGEASLELTLSQFWSSLGGSNIEVELSFHGLSVSPAAADTSSGAAVTNDTLLLNAAAGPLKVRVCTCVCVFLGSPITTAPSHCDFQKTLCDVNLSPRMRPRRSLSDPRCAGSASSLTPS